MTATAERRREDRGRLRLVWDVLYRGLRVSYGQAHSFGTALGLFLVFGALIAIERSLAAWVAMREMFPEETDSMLEILLHLDRLRRSVQRKFPRAKSFRRPGFDDKPRKTA